MESKSVLKREAVQKGEPMPQDITVSELPSVTGYVPELICTVCLEAYEGEDGLTYICDQCGRGGFCKGCSNTENHDCE